MNTKITPRRLLTYAKRPRARSAGGREETLLCWCLSGIRVMMSFGRFFMLFGMSPGQGCLIFDELRLGGRAVVGHGQTEGEGDKARRFHKQSADFLVDNDCCKVTGVCLRMPYTILLGMCRILEVGSGKSEVGRERWADAGCNTASTAAIQDAAHRRDLSVAIASQHHRPYLRPACFGRQAPSR